MIAAALAFWLAAQPSPAPVLPPASMTASGEWLVVSVGRVIAPDQHPGECFVQGRVEQVVHGTAYRTGDAIALTLACRNGGYDRTQATRTPEPVTIQTLRSQKRALVHVDSGGRVLGNGFYGLGGLQRLQPG